MTAGMVVLVTRPGVPTPSMVQTWSGATVYPDAEGRIVVTPYDAQPLLAAGWIEQLTLYQAANPPGGLLMLDVESGDVFQVAA